MMSGQGLKFAWTYSVLLLLEHKTLTIGYFLCGRRIYIRFGWLEIHTTSSRFYSSTAQCLGLECRLIEILKLISFIHLMAYTYGTEKTQNEQHGLNIA